MSQNNIKMHFNEWFDGGIGHYIETKKNYYYAEYIFDNGQSMKLHRISASTFEEAYQRKLEGNGIIYEC